ncbi:hypothetical protein GYMLUDRAFT_584611 [Collybiopsis luxurians FD-317 M1]|uniref:Uncharacterized protein n=1 Tax=Collybiopsis luxurians FD-317 M1 TaxID=944289 RepID=A0A0D0CQZ7_9AGAR|nr:hypothetical protein GYMLUDRAFT_584611 [Collybiopsis luxurians FD-317 M1]
MSSIFRPVQDRAKPFPESLNINEQPPWNNTLVEGGRVPKYSLGWVLSREDARTRLMYVALQGQRSRCRLRRM